MKNTTLAALSVLSLLSAAHAARADGFVCGTDDRELNIQVYHNTDVSEGTRTVAVMLLSDPDAPRGEQTIARFDHSNATLTNHGATYIAQTEETAGYQADIYVSSIPLDQIRMVDLDIAFSYTNPADAGTTMPGVLTISAANGQAMRKDVSCVRYLKN